MNQIFIIMEHDKDGWVYKKELNKKNDNILNGILNEGILKKISETCDLYEKIENKPVKYVGGILMRENNDYDLVCYGAVEPIQQ